MKRRACAWWVRYWWRPATIGKPAKPTWRSANNQTIAAKPRCSQLLQKRLDTIILANKAIAKYMFKRYFLVIGAIITPCLIMTTYLMTLYPVKVGSNYDVYALILSTLSGLPFIFFLPIKTLLRYTLGFLYIPIMGLILIYCTLVFVCIYYKNCL